MTVYYVWVFPRILVEDMEISKGKMLALFALMYSFWSGLFLYFLTDAVALMFLSIGIYFLFLDKKIGYLLGGVFMYITYNTRTIYLFPIIVIILFLFIYKLRAKDKSVFLATVFIFAGIILAAIPQVIVNKNNHGVISAKVYTAGNSGDYGNGLFSWQLAQGLKLAEYETYVGVRDKHSSGGVAFTDTTGERIWREEGIDSQTVIIKDIVKLFFKYPLDMVGIYVRHFINMLNPVWGEMYIKNLEKVKIHLTIINYIILYIIVYWNIGVKEKSIKNIKELLTDSNKEKLKIYITRCTLLIPCIAILPGSVELRFFYPMYMLIYVYLIYNIGLSGIKKVWMSCKKITWYLYRVL